MDFFNKTLFPNPGVKVLSIPEILFVISRKKCRTLWFTACKCMFWRLPQNSTYVP